MGEGACSKTPPFRLQFWPLWIKYKIGGLCFSGWTRTFKTIMQNIRRTQILHIHFNLLFYRVLVTFWMISMKHKKPKELKMVTWIYGMTVIVLANFKGKYNNHWFSIFFHYFFSVMVIVSNSVDISL